MAHDDNGPICCIYNSVPCNQTILAGDAEAIRPRSIRRRLSAWTNHIVDDSAALRSIHKMAAAPSPRVRQHAVGQNRIHGMPSADNNDRA